MFKGAKRDVRTAKAHHAAQWAFLLEVLAAAQAVVQDAYGWTLLDVSPSTPQTLPDCWCQDAVLIEQFKWKGRVMKERVVAYLRQIQRIIDDRINFANQLAYRAGRGDLADQMAAEDILKQMLSESVARQNAAMQYWPR